MLKVTFYRCSACDFESSRRANVARHNASCDPNAACREVQGTIIPDDRPKPLELSFFTKYRLDQYHSILTQRVPYKPPRFDDYEYRVANLMKHQAYAVRGAVTQTLTEQSLVGRMFRFIAGDRSLESNRFVWRMNDSDIVATYINEEIKICHIDSIIEKTIEYTVDMMFEIARVCESTNSEKDVAKIFYNITGTDKTKFLESIDVYPVWCNDMKPYFPNLFIHA